jgi:hypothetical protein
MSDYSPSVLQAFHAELEKIAVSTAYPEFEAFEKVAEQIIYDWHDLPLETQLYLFEKRANFVRQGITRVGQALGLVAREGGEEAAKALATRQAVAQARLARMRPGPAPVRRTVPTRTAQSVEQILAANRATTSQLAPSGMVAQGALPAATRQARVADRAYAAAGWR